MTGLSLGEAVSSASGREDSLSQDSHVLFMSLPLMDVTVNELLVQYTLLFHHLQKVNVKRKVTSFIQIMITEKL